MTDSRLSRALRLIEAARLLDSPCRLTLYQINHGGPKLEVGVWWTTDGYRAGFESHPVDLEVDEHATPDAALSALEARVRAVWG